MGLADRARMQISAMAVVAAPRLRQGAGVFVLAGLGMAALALISHNPPTPASMSPPTDSRNRLGFWARPLPILSTKSWGMRCGLGLSNCGGGPSRHHTRTLTLPHAPYFGRHVGFAGGNGAGFDASGS